MASLNAPGFSISLLNLTHVAKTFASISSEPIPNAISTTSSTKSQEVTSISVEALLELIDAPHASAAWPGGDIYPLPEHLQRRCMGERFIDVPDHPEAQVNGNEKKDGRDEPKVFGQCLVIHRWEWWEFVLIAILYRSRSEGFEKRAAGGRRGRLQGRTGSDTVGYSMFLHPLYRTGS